MHGSTLLKIQHFLKTKKYNKGWIQTLVSLKWSSPYAAFTSKQLICSKLSYSILLKELLKSLFWNKPPVMNINSRVVSEPSTWTHGRAERQTKESKLQEIGKQHLLDQSNYSVQLNSLWNTWESLQDSREDWHLKMGWIHKIRTWQIQVPEKTGSS